MRAKPESTIMHRNWERIENSRRRAEWAIVVLNLELNIGAILNSYWLVWWLFSGDESTQNVWHVLLLVEGFPCIVRFNQSDLWPVTALICFASLSDNTVTAVALIQRLVRCGVIQYHTVESFSVMNFPDCSLGRWNRQSNLGLRCLRKFSIVFTGQGLELITSNIFPSDSSVESLSLPWWFSVDIRAPLWNSSYHLP